MTLEDIYYIGQTFAVIGIFGSLIFVGIQIRQNTRVTRAHSHNAVSDGLNQINRLFIESGDVTRIWLAGMKDRQALTESDRWRFDSALRAYMHVCETMYIQANLGVGDRSIMTAEENGIRTIFTSPGAREWWAENPYGFCTEFREYIDGLVMSP